MENLVINADSLTAFPEGLIQGPDGTQDFGFSSGTLDDSAASGLQTILGESSLLGPFTLASVIGPDVSQGSSEFLWFTSVLCSQTLGTGWGRNMSMEEGSWGLVQRKIFFFFFDMYTLLYLFILATLSLCCCTWAFSSCRARGPLSSCSAWAFIVVASRCRAQASVVEALELSSCKLAGSWALGLSSCSSRPLEHGLSSCGTPG